MATLAVLKRIDDLILEEGYTDYCYVLDEHKAELTALSIRDLGEYAHEVLVENEGVNVCINHLIGYLINDSNESAIKLAETIRSNSIKYFDKTLSDLFDMRVSELESDRKLESGLKSNIDKTTGEILWTS